ncbi:hypothetical protein FPHYL_7205 [Fusarium phyllophilum]|uniref:Uncharacterized protein n=1 Tax=Fusarium phyllophilum TaxID=47803 RepID=A0A8H5NBE9_9HYPO|nr:hypothetical protein FPHYL_7205 [Fusarium phyllophilum]
MGQPKYRQMTAQFKGKDGVELKREPKDDPLVFRYGSNGIQQVNLDKRLLTYTLFIDFTDPDKAMGKLWKVLSKMKVFDQWEASQSLRSLLPSCLTMPFGASMVEIMDKA